MRLLPLLILAIVPLATPFAPANPRPGGRPGGAWPATGDCGRCHLAIHDEWKHSKHAAAWTDEIYRKALATKRRPRSCWSCHVPESVLARLPKKPKFRDRAREAGVHCAACHVLGDKIHGPFGAPTQAHESAKHPAFAPGAADLCLSCHKTKVGPVLPLGRDFLASPLPGKGKDCRHCHMPAVERPLAVDPDTGKPSGPKRKTRSHRILGPSDTKFLAKAFELAARRRSDGKVELVVRNHAGHRIPGLKLRTFDLSASLRTKEGKTLFAQRFVLDGTRQLMFGEELTAIAPSPPAGARFVLEVVHRLAVPAPKGKTMQVLEVGKLRKEIPVAGASSGR